jgi:hypothetical protein
MSGAEQSSSSFRARKDSHARQLSGRERPEGARELSPGWSGTLGARTP